MKEIFCMAAYSRVLCYRKDLATMVYYQVARLWVGLYSSVNFTDEEAKSTTLSIAPNKTFHFLFHSCRILATYMIMLCSFLVALAA